jgi:O-antigen ligase
MSKRFDRDLTFTGRTQIWRDVFDKAQSDGRTLFGYGIGGFWGKIGSPSSKIDNVLFADIAQSHNGLIDIYIQFGLIGVCLFIIYLFSIFIYLSKIKSKNQSVFFFNLFFIFFIFNNLVESSYLQPKNIINEVFILIVIYILNSRITLNFHHIKYMYKYREIYKRLNVNDN